MKASKRKCSIPSEEDNSDSTATDASENESDLVEEESAVTNMDHEYDYAFEILADLFPEKFKIKEDSVRISEAQKRFKAPKSKPQLIINPYTDNTWLDPKTRIDESDTITYWPPEIKLPQGPNPFTPKYSPKPPPRPKDISISNKNLKKMLEAPKLGKLRLDSSIFNDSSSDVSSSPHTKIDLFLRTGLFEDFIAGEFLDIAILLIPIVMKEINSVIPDCQFASLMILEKVIGFASFNNSRSVHNQIAAFVNNKAALREMVLKTYKAPESTLDLLRGSDFAWNSLFGPMPESFKDTLKTAIGKDLTCTRSVRAKGRARGTQRYNNYRRSLISTSLRNTNLRRGKFFLRGRGKNRKSIPQKKETGTN